MDNFYANSKDGRFNRKRKVFVALAVLLIVQACNDFQLHSFEVKNNVFRDSKQPSQLAIVIPNVPDPLPEKKIRDAMNIEIDELISLPMKSSHCNATAQVLLFMNGTRWKMQALDLNGIPKTIGGDEFYVTYHHNGYLFQDITVPEQSKAHPTAVAQVTDLGNGNYDLDFIASPMAAKENFPLSSLGGNLTIHFAYTCSIGKIPPPLKANWNNGGYSQTSYTVEVPFAPQIKIFDQPKQPNIDLSNFDHIMLVGDSLMEQFGFSPFMKIKTAFRSNVTFSGNVGCPLNNQTVDKFAMKTFRMLSRMDNLQGTKTADVIKVAVVLGSSSWDILADDVGQGEEFIDHRNAMRNLIKKIRSFSFSNVALTLFWKSATAVHSHVVVNKRTKWFGNIAKATKRIKYMSSTRSHDLYEYQKGICIEMDVPFLDVYDAYFLSADWHFPTDGRHYRPELNEVIFNSFFSTPAGHREIDYSYHGY